MKTVASLSRTKVKSASSVRSHCSICVLRRHLGMHWSQLCLLTCVSLTCVFADLSRLPFALDASQETPWVMESGHHGARSADSMYFMALGDWGNPQDEAQAQVAQSMKDRAEAEGGIDVSVSSAPPDEQS